MAKKRSTSPKKKGDTRKKRTPQEIEDDQKRAWELRCLHYSWSEVADIINEGKRYKITYQQCQQDVKLYKKIALDAMAKERVEILMVEVAKLDLYEAELMREWEKSKKELTHLEQIEKKKEGNTELVKKQIKKTSAANERYMILLLEISKDRRKLLSLETTKVVENEDGSVEVEGSTEGVIVMLPDNGR